MIPTFVEGLDESLEGGIPEGHVVLLAGTAGTLKSTLAFYILYHNALAGRPGLYVTLEQGAPQLLWQMGRLGLDPARTGGRLRVEDLGRTRRETGNQNWRASWLEVIRGLVDADRAERKTQLFVLDSISVTEAPSDAVGLRPELFGFFEALRETGMTSLLLSEMGMDSREYSRSGADFLADGILHVRLVMEDDVRRYRRLGVVKMRGVNHSMEDSTLLLKGGRLRCTSVLRT
ncbi:MAG: hypothetical protein HY558_06780 [Euryarchaeota archaeon]|nr:hypothetical protein [Euryarchaeota archaeon]